MYVRMYVCMYVCMYVRTYVCTCMPQFWSVLSLELQNKIAKASRAHSMVHYGIYILEGIKESANPTRPSTLPCRLNITRAHIHSKHETELN